MGNEQEQEIKAENVEWVFKTGLMLVMVGLVLLFIYISGCSYIEILIPAGTVGGVGIIAVIVSIAAWGVAKSQEPEVKDKKTNKFCELERTVDKLKDDFDLIKKRVELLQFREMYPSGIALYSKIGGRQVINYIKDGELKLFELPNNATFEMTLRNFVANSYFDHYTLDEKTKIITKYRHDVKKDKDTLLRQYKFDQEEEILVGIDTKTKKVEKKWL